MYSTSLNWQKSLDTFTAAEKKILVALSLEKFKWRTKERLLKATGFSPSYLDSQLANLIEKKVITPASSKKLGPIFSLRERIG